MGIKVTALDSVSEALHSSDLYYVAKFRNVFSGSLIVGATYTIASFVAGDDFANVANVQSGTINTSGCVFIATGTTPTNWTNSSSLTFYEHQKVTWNQIQSGINYYYKTVNVSSAQILDLHNTPITLIYALGAGKSITIDKIIGVYSHNTTAYTGGLGSTFNVFCGAEAIINTDVALLTNASNEYKYNPQDGNSVPTPNENIILDNLGAAWTLGDGTVTLHIYYTVTDL